MPGSEQAAGDLEVRLGVLEPDRVDLVRHRRRAGRARDRDLREEAHRDVGPDVGREVVQDAARVPHAVVQLDLPVVRLDLGREHVEVDAEAFDELARQLGPVDVGRGGQMRRPGAGRAGELREVLARRDLGGHALEAPGEDGELLAHRRRGRRLAVRAGEHRGIPVLTGELAEGGDHGAQLRQPDVLDGALDGERVGGRVDVLARAGEVGELGDGVEPERAAGRARGTRRPSRRDG
jgi:hypothetical protein